MISDTEMNIKKLMRNLKVVQPRLKKSMGTLVKQSARQVVEVAMAHTPPGGKDVSGKAAQMRGEANVASDLFGGRKGAGGMNKKQRRMGIFFAVKESILRRFKNNKGRVMIDGQGRKIKIKARQAVDSEVLFKKADGTVYATQQNMYRPNASMDEMMAHHRKYFKKGRMTSSVSGLATTGQWVFVDSFVTTKEKLQEFAEILYKRVGIWAAGFMPAAQKLKARKVPAWIKRHSHIAKGRCLFIETGDKFIIEIANSTGYGNIQKLIDVGLKASRRMMIKDAQEKKAHALAEAGFNK